MKRKSQEKKYFSKKFSTKLCKILHINSKNLKIKAKKLMFHVEHDFFSTVEIYLCFTWNINNYNIYKIY